MITSRHRRRHQQTADMNITAFMNLMVILVPFLLVTAVFSRVAILPLNLPAAEADQALPPDQILALEVTLRGKRIEISNRGSTPVIVENTAGGYNLKALADVLKQVKINFPEETNITLLLEPETKYDDLVQVMDAVRVARVIQGNKVVKAELFPDISIGDAPSPGDDGQPG